MPRNPVIPAILQEKGAKMPHATKVSYDTLAVHSEHANKAPSVKKVPCPVRALFYECFDFYFY